MGGYKCFYNGKTCEVYANTSYEAQGKAQAIFKVKDNKRYLITAMLCETNGNQVTHTADF
jgi:predicted secreted protein